MLYEDPKEDPTSEKRFHIELHFSPGTKGVQAEESFPQGSGYRPSSQPPSRAVSLQRVGSENFLRVLVAVAVTVAVVISFMVAFLNKLFLAESISRGVDTQ